MPSRGPLGTGDQCELPQRGISVTNLNASSPAAAAWIRILITLLFLLLVSVCCCSPSHYRKIIKLGVQCLSMTCGLYTYTTQPCLYEQILQCLFTFKVVSKYSRVQFGVKLPPLTWKLFFCLCLIAKCKWVDKRANNQIHFGTIAHNQHPNCLDSICRCE